MVEGGDKAIGVVEGTFGDKRVVGEGGRDGSGHRYVPNSR